MSGLGADGLRSSTHLGLHVGADWSVRCRISPDKPPILTVHVGRTLLSFSPAGTAVPSDHVEFAYALLGAVNDYLVECERFRFAVQDAAELPRDLAA
ncbi:MULTISPECIES: hypothetical protein [Protofrankia]|uniref:Uncharacterized protein n=1 Tax=Candidatus Protofrankia datiscae TaxID=2716812 RepID=F8B129_9ACTN|nr:MULTISPECIES: hypothetical protein [Protofrankia]AEH07661.1 hypothetical protein FsymDg_0075 [Candidatus Protofrankia datiscae]